MYNDDAKTETKEMVEMIYPDAPRQDGVDAIKKVADVLGLEVTFFAKDEQPFLNDSVAWRNENTFFVGFYNSPGAGTVMLTDFLAQVNDNAMKTRFVGFKK
jgi:hypothetical protein